MDQRERVFDPEETLRQVMDSRLSRLWTSLVCQITKYNAAKQTVEVQPAGNARQRQPDGTYVSIQMPILVDIPVQFPSAGGVSITFPVTNGDECLVVFSARSIDAWFANGYMNGSPAAPNPGNDAPEFRMHNLSDGMALLGFRNQKRALSGVSTTKMQIRSDTGETYIELDPTGHIVNVVAPGGINLNGVTIDSSGNVVSPATIKGTTVTGTTEVVAKTGGSAVHLSTHTHAHGAAPDPGS